MLKIFNIFDIFHMLLNKKSGSRSIIVAITVTLCIICISVISFSNWRVHNIQKELDESNKNNSKLILSIKKQQEVIASLKRDMENIRKINEHITEVATKQKEQVKKLNKKFNYRPNGTKRNFGAIARAKPKLIEKAINKATDRLSKCFEVITSSASSTSSAPSASSASFGHSSQNSKNEENIYENCGLSWHSE